MHSFRDGCGAVCKTRQGANEGNPWDLRRSGVLCSEWWCFLTEVSGQPNSTIFKVQDSWSLKMLPRGFFSETSVMNYHHALHNTPEEGRSSSTSPRKPEIVGKSHIFQGSGIYVGDEFSSIVCALIWVRFRWCQKTAFSFAFSSGMKIFQ
jgi:hypothetical protein